MFIRIMHMKMSYAKEGVFFSVSLCYSYLAPPLLRYHDDVIKWKHFLRYWPFVRGIHRPLVNSPHKGQWRGALMSLLICAWINGWVNNRVPGDLRRHRTHYDVIVMYCKQHVLDTDDNIKFRVSWFSSNGRWTSQLAELDFVDANYIQYII